MKKNSVKDNMNYSIFHVLCILELESFISEVMLNTFLKIGKKSCHRGKWLLLYRLSRIEIQENPALFLSKSHLISSL